MEFTISLGLGGWTVLMIGALVAGVIAEFVGETTTSYEWVPVAIAAAIGAIVASEFIIGWQAFEPVWDGLALLPALAGGLVFGLVAEFATRYLTGGTYFGRPATV
jgi:uncharacterized membrane protein YeaQ/YmgE (transglycosylase-associated protein family)